MQSLKEQYLVDANGNRLSVVIPFDEYQRLLEHLEELESLYAFDTAMELQDESIPLEQAIAEIEQER
ncbi:hypothetical protein [Pseudanabaena sp. PCC 6802]|uniref:hypothetical protein n=1 Tax=Pseudanabaena sp. PCC 6802 TaxID=118173 RepID=UPI000348ADD3|nr:hypothetical protein [Pseudanabaena sp. PCC 6802]